MENYPSFIPYCSEVKQYNICLKKKHSQSLVTIKWPGKALTFSAIHEGIKGNGPWLNFLEKKLSFFCAINWSIPQTIFIESAFFKAKWILSHGDISSLCKNSGIDSTPGSHLQGPSQRPYYAKHQSSLDSPLVHNKVNHLNPRVKYTYAYGQSGNQSNDICHVPALHPEKETNGTASKASSPFLLKCDGKKENIPSTHILFSLHFFNISIPEKLLLRLFVPLLAPRTMDAFLREASLRATP